MFRSIAATMTCAVLIASGGCVGTGAGAVGVVPAVPTDSSTSSADPKEGVAVSKEVRTDVTDYVVEGERWKSLLDRFTRW